MIKFILLGLLNYQPMTGYELKQTIDHSVSHFWHAYHSQIYTQLRQMEADGLVSSEFVYTEGQPDRRIYSMTDAGRVEFETWLGQSLTGMSPIKEELLVRLFFSARRDKKSVLAELYLQRELHQKKLNEYSRLEGDFTEDNKKTIPQREDDAVYWKMTLNMGIGYEKMYLEWLNQTIHEIDLL